MQGYNFDLNHLLYNMNMHYMNVQQMSVILSPISTVIWNTPKFTDQIELAATHADKELRTLPNTKIFPFCRYQVPLSLKLTVQFASCHNYRRVGQDLPDWRLMSCQKDDKQKF